jgi:hypothetical protein
MLFSSALVMANATHEPRRPWSFTGESYFLPGQVYLPNLPPGVWVQLPAKSP